MSGMILALLILNCLVALVWLIRHVVISRAGRILPPLTPDLYGGPVDDLPPISMLVAAKDEERNIGGCVESILRQQHPHLQAVAVNDRSGDATGQILDTLAARDSRLTAIHVKSLRDGWFGKNNAMREGVEAATADWLCFTDADCILESPRCLAIAQRYAMANNIDFLSILPNLDNNSFWERIIQPACGGIMMIWFNPLKVNNPAKKNAYANGAFMLMKRACYDAIGGHEPVKAEVNEDMHMARIAKGAGLRLHVVSNERLYTVRMYNSLKQTWNGWSRIFYGCFGSFRRLILSAIVVMIFTLMPWITLAAAGLAEWRSPDRQSVQPLLIAAAIACAAQLSVMFRFYRLSHSSPLYAMLYPVGAAIGLGALVNAMRRLSGRGTTTWRGTVYRGDKVEGSTA